LTNPQRVIASACSSLSSKSVRTGLSRGLRRLLDKGEDVRVKDFKAMAGAVKLRQQERDSGVGRMLDDLDEVQQPQLPGLLELPPSRVVPVHNARRFGVVLPPKARRAIRAIADIWPQSHVDEDGIEFIAAH